MCVREFHVALLLAAAVTFASPASAQEAVVSLGQQIATQGTSQGVAACASCHGTQGAGNAAFPLLAGSGQVYLQAQLDAFADGSRKNPTMQSFAQKLSATERMALAKYYSQLPAPIRVGSTSAGTASAMRSDAGAWLATRGRWTDNLPACAQCHGHDGGGVGAQFPPLAGLPATYITEQLQAWKAGGRPPGPLDLMPAVASKLSDHEVDAVAAYYAELPAAASREPTSAPAKGTGGAVQHKN